VRVKASLNLNREFLQAHKCQSVNDRFGAVIPARSPTGFGLRAVLYAPCKLQISRVPRVKISTAFIATPSASTPHLVDDESLEFLFSAASPNVRDS
jgi:hypothetical protein